MMVFLNRTVDQSNKQINKTLGFLGAGRVGVLRPPGQEPACTLPPVPRTAHTPVQTRVLPCPGFAVRRGQWLLLTAASPGALACRPFFPPASLCPSRSVFSRVAVFGQASPPGGRCHTELRGRARECRRCPGGPR